MNNQSWFKRHWKLAVNLLTFLALAVLIYASRHQLLSTIHNITHANAWALLLMIPIEALNYHAQSKLYQRMFDIVGNKLSYKFLYRASLELNFVNHVFPSGGVTGISFFSLRMRSGKELTGSKATLVHLLKLVLTYLSFELILVFGAIALAVEGRVNGLVILAVGSISTFLFLGTILFVYLLGSRERINSFFTLLTRALNRIIRIVRPGHPETINISQAKKVFDDFHENYQQIQAHKAKLKAPFWYAFLANLTEVMAIYVVYIAFGKYVNIGAIILAYAISNVAGLVSIMPGGFGIYEGLMTAVLAITGISPGVSLPITLTYRILNTLIQIPPGYYLYNRTLKKGKTLTKTEVTDG
jgi:uncharacterized protein (TIRG00374 family)